MYGTTAGVQYPASGGICAKWYRYRVDMGPGSREIFFSNITVTAEEGKIRCTGRAFGNQMGCLFNETVVTDVPEWLLDTVGDPLPDLPPAETLVVQIHS